MATGFDLVSLGLIRNSDLDITTGIPGSNYTSFGGEPVGPHDLLLKYTYIGDANLNGVVSFDDYIGMDNAFFGLVPNLGWATGDVNLDGAINFDDYSKVDQAFFFQGSPLPSVGEPEASAPGVMAGGTFAATTAARRWALSKNRWGCARPYKSLTSRRRSPPAKQKAAQVLVLTCKQPTRWPTRGSV